MYRLPLLLLVCFGGIFYPSCSPTKKIQTTKTEITDVNKKLEENKDKLTDLDKLRKEKEESNEIDDTVNARIKKFIQKTEEEINETVNENQVLIAGVAVKKEDWNKLKNALTKSQKSLSAIENKVAFINDLLNRNMVVKLDQDVLFEPGQYEVSSGVAASINSFFEPASKEIEYFVNKYPAFPLSLVITAKGYADGTTIAENSTLYRQLKERLTLQTDKPDNTALNKELSRVRAQKVIDLFKKFTNNRPGGNSIQNVLYLYEGKGEAFPDPKQKDYKTNDPRRRVVLLFWSVFPE